MFAWASRQNVFPRASLLGCTRVSVLAVVPVVDACVWRWSVCVGLGVPGRRWSAVLAWCVPSWVTLVGLPTGVALVRPPECCDFCRNMCCEGINIGKFGWGCRTCGWGCGFCSRGCVCDRGYGWVPCALDSVIYRVCQSECCLHVCGSPAQAVTCHLVKNWAWQLILPQGGNGAL